MFGTSVVAAGRWAPAADFCGCPLHGDRARVECMLVAQRAQFFVPERARGGRAGYVNGKHINVLALLVDELEMWCV